MAMELARVRLCALSSPPPPSVRAGLELRERAKLATGRAFDQMVLEVLRQASPNLVAHSHVVLRLGGPRWKFQSSVARLEERGEVRRLGAANNRRYGIVIADEHVKKV